MTCTKPDLILQPILLKFQTATSAGGATADLELWIPAVAPLEEPRLRKRLQTEAAHWNAIIPTFRAMGRRRAS